MLDMKLSRYNFWLIKLTLFTGSTLILLHVLVIRHFNTNWKTSSLTSHEDRMYKAVDYQELVLKFKEKKRIFFYNRIHKCGSRTVNEIMAAMPNLTLLHSKIFRDERIPSTKQLELVHLLNNAVPPFLFDRHLHFINFERFGYENPIYINVVRDPLDRLISHFNYYHYKPAVNFEECLNMRIPYCGTYCENTGDYLISKSVEYFAGQGTSSFCGERQLHLAKANLVRYYAVVGYMENLHQFFAMLGWLFPDVFGNATKKYLGLGRNMREKTKSNHTYLPERNTTVVLKRRLRYEYDLYYFVKAMHDELYEKMLSDKKQHS